MSVVVLQTYGSMPIMLGCSRHYYQLLPESRNGSLRPVWRFCAGAKLRPPPVRASTAAGGVFVARSIVGQARSPCLRRTGSKAGQLAAP
jgi:hypothetical protein